MILGGLQKFSALDYPGKLATIVFTQGCNFRCHFCYNPMLVRPLQLGKLKNTASQKSVEAKQESHLLIEEGDFFEFLEERRGKLEAVVVTGGEPTLHADLPEFVKKIKALGYLLKLDTNGTNPAMLEKLLANKLLDYLAMDLKSSPAKYDLVTGVATDLKKIQKSAIVIKESGLPYEFRTTVVPDLVDLEDIAAMGQMITGAAQWYLQKFRSNTELLNKSFEAKQAHQDTYMEKMRQEASRYVKSCLIR